MATTTRILDANVNGTVYTANANSALEALDTCHSGATAPTDEVANGKLWLDTSTTPGILKIYNNATWEAVLTATGTSQVKLDGIEASADVTDAINVEAAGALMDSEMADIGSVKALNQGVATTDSPTFTALSDGTDTVETGYVVNGSAKAWVNLNGTGTIAIRDSLNVASLTDGGVGVYTANFTNSMGNTNYMANVSAAIPANTVQTDLVSLTASGAAFGVINGTASAVARADTTVLCASTHGDLA